MIGAAELQNLANTYNSVYLENQETQKLICHQAEHDALTEALMSRFAQNVTELRARRN